MVLHLTCNDGGDGIMGLGRRGSSVLVAASGVITIQTSLAGLSRPLLECLTGAGCSLSSTRQ